MAGGKIWTKEELDYINKNYNDKDTETMSKELNRSKSAIICKAHDLQIKAVTRSHWNTFDEDVFDIPTVENSYWAGFIAADGCLLSGKPCLVIQLANKDLEHVKKFKTFTKGTSEIGHQISTNSDYFRVYNCFKYYEDLNKYFNIIPKKSLILQPPNITDINQIKAFIVGYIDGDGCIPKKYTEKAYCLILGTYNMLFWINTFFDQQYGISMKNIKIHKQSNIYQLHFMTKQARTVLEDLKHSVDVPRLARKWDRVK